jgi:hypothetical protein
VAKACKQGSVIWPRGSADFCPGQRAKGSGDARAERKGDDTVCRILKPGSAE